MSFHSISIPHEILRDFSVLWHDIWEQKNIAWTQGNNFKYFWEIYLHISENITRFLDKKNTVNVLQNYPCIALRWLEPVFF